MARTAIPGRLNWQLTTVADKRAETPRVTTVGLTSDAWPGHLPGQHVDVRLTAEDGYQAQRSYSIASAPQEGSLELTVEDLHDGEVSPYLTEELRDGDLLELRGPIGGYFTWTEQNGGPVLLVAGGSGVVPLMSILRFRQAVGSNIPMTLLYSSRSWDEIIYREELDRLAADGKVLVAHTLTRTQPDGWDGYRRRIDAEMLEEVAGRPKPGMLAYVCGPTALVENVAGSLVGLGFAPDAVKTERFGPTGGEK
jgi:ferredoxin-NADP reductase